METTDIFYPSAMTLLMAQTALWYHTQGIEHKFSSVRVEQISVAS